jgi:hypothetical protein
VKSRKIMKADKSELAAKIMAYGATAAGLLAVAQPASAAVVYSGAQNLPLSYPGNTQQDIDLNNDGTDDFSFNALSYGYYQNFSANSSNQFIRSNDGTRPGPTLGHSDAANLPLNYVIQSGLPAVSLAWTTNGEPVAGNYYSGGSFNNATGYLGVRFHSAACTGSDWNYGWIQFSNAGLNNGTIIDWAYESTCNTQILTAQGSTAPTRDVPTLDQWGMLIMTGLLSGAAIYRMRKDRKKA